MPVARGFSGAGGGWPSGTGQWAFEEGRALGDKGKNRTGQAEARRRTRPERTEARPQGRAGLRSADCMNHEA